MDHAAIVPVPVLSLLAPAVLALELLLQCLDLHTQVGTCTDVAQAFKSSHLGTATREPEH